MVSELERKEEIGQNFNKELNDDEFRYLSEIWYHPRHPLSFSSINDLYTFSKKKFPDITIKKVQSFLSQQRAWTRHKRIKQNFPRRKVPKFRIDEVWCTDLIEVDLISNFNSGARFILLNCDHFSKKIWTRPLLNKKPETIVKAFESIIFLISLWP